MQTTRFATLILLSATVALAAPPVSDTLSSAPSRFASLEETKVHYKSLGSGTDAFVLVHGWTCDLNFWRLQAPALAERARVVALDLPGHGRSDKPETQYTMDYFARAIEAVVKDAGVERAVLVGHSMGTPVIRQYYRRHPGKTLALITVDGTLRPFMRTPEEADRFLQPFREDYGKAAVQFVDSMLPNTMEPELKEQIRSRMLAAPRHVGVSAMESMADPAIWTPDPIGVPVLVLMAKSPFWPKDYPDFVRSLSKDVEYREFDGVSHFLMLEIPERFNEAMLSFLAGRGLLQ